MVFVRMPRSVVPDGRFRVRVAVGLAIAMVMALLPGTAPVLAAQQNEIVLGVEYDGLQPNGDAPFAGNTDGQHTPGDDDNQNNNVVLTNDLIGYRIDWNVNEVDGTTVALTASLPEGMSWVVDPGTNFGAPSGCVDDGMSTIDTNAGRDLYCVLDVEHEGSNGVIRPQANAGSQFDATSLQLQAFIESGESAPIGSNVVETFASARPKADWVKGEDVLSGDPPVVVDQQPSEEIHGVTDPATGEIGRIWLYPLRLLPVGGIVGAEKMDDSQDILIYDHAYQMPAGAKLATGLVPDTVSGAPRTACGPYDGLDTFPVASPGTWTCALDPSSTANGYPVIRIDISGHDTSVLPALNGDATSNTTTMMAGQIAFFVPESAFPSGAFSIDINNGLSGTVDPVALPTDLTPIQVWGSAPTSFDEAGVENNNAYWNANAVPANEAPGRTFRQTVHYKDGPYYELSKQFPDGRDYRSIDARTVTAGGLGRVMTNTLGSTLFGWGNGVSGPMSQITPRGNELVLVAELGHIQSAPETPYYYEASSLCVAIDNTHQSLMALPATFDVNHLVATSSPFSYGNQPHDATTTESSNTGPLAQVHIGSQPNFVYHIPTYLHAVETTLVDIPYVVEFAAGLNIPDQDVGMHEVTCNNADVDGRGWVDSAGDLSVFDSVAPGDDVYEDITHVRLRVTGPMQWTGSPLNPRNVSSSSTWGTAINLNMQVKVKADPLANQADQELFAYASRAYTPSPLPHTPEEVVVWDPVTMANPGTPTCTNTTNGVFQNRYGDGVDHNTVIPNGWCNLPFEDDGSSSVDLADNPFDFGGGGENAYELASNSNSSYTGKYPRVVHADKVTIVEAALSIGKSNLAGPNDVNVNGDLAEFEVRPGVVGSSLDTISDIVVTDTLPAQYEFVGFTQLPVTAVNSNATTPPNNDGVALTSPVCSVSGQTITCDFGTQVGGWSDSFRYEVRIKDATANATYTNTATISGNDALSGVAKDPKSASAKSFTPAAFDESGIIKMVDRHVGPCGVYPGGGAAPADWADDCSVIVADGGIRYELDVENEGFDDLENYRVIDILPHLGDEVEIASNTLTGDGRTPESDFSGTVELVSAAGAGTTFLYSMDDPNTVTRDPDLSETTNTWCDAAAGGVAVFGAGACPGSLADVTAVYADMGTLDASSVRTLTVDLMTSGNECGDVYTNNFGARTDGILLPIRSNDVSAMVGFCEPEVDIEKDTNGVQADNVDEDLNGNGVLDPGEDTNDENGVLDVAAPAGSNVGPGVPVGGAVTWTYVVTNGDVALTNAVVADSDPAVIVDCDIDGDGTFDGTDTVPVLLPLAEITCQATGVAVAGQYSNNSSVTGTPAVPTAVDPSIDPLDSSTWPDDPDFDPEDESTWPLDPAIDLSDPTTWPSDPADYGQPVDPVTGESVFPAVLTDEDPSHYWGLPNEVGVDIEKDTNGVQADDNPGPSVPVGDTVTWTYVVTNTGQLPITPATVADSDPALSVVCDASLADAGGDEIIDMFLPGESVSCTATGVATAGVYENTATVSGPTSLPTESCVCDPLDPATWPTTADGYEPNLDADGNPITVNDSDVSHYNGAAPAIDVEKTTNGVQSDEAPGEEIVAGSTVTWTYVVTNTGTTALADATVTDDQGVTVDCDVNSDGIFDGTNVISFIAPGSSVTCEGTGVAVAGGYTNNASVTGDPIVPDFATCGCDPEDVGTWPTELDAYSPLMNSDGTPVDPVTDEDPSNYTGGPSEGAAIDIEKATNGVDSDEAPGETVLVGSTVTWTYVVTNTGTTGLANATVTDDQGVVVDCGDGSNVIGYLAPGASVTCEGTGVAVDGPYTNNASVSGDPIVPDFGTCGCDPADPATWPADPSGFVPAVGADGQPLAPVTDEDPSNYTGSVDANNSVGDFVWYDSNGDGVQDADEVPAEGIIVNLYDDAGNLIATTTTDANGFYEFTGLADGKYQVEFVKPAGYEFTAADQGSDDAGDSDADLFGKSPIIDLDSAGAISDGVRDETIDAGLVLAQGLGGIVWFDTNGDGIQDPDEVVVPGVLVELLDESGNPVLDADGNPITAITDENGAYYFPVEPGNYTLKFSPGADATFSQGTGSDNDLADLLNGLTGSYTVNPGEQVLGIDAPLIPATLAFTGLDALTMAQLTAMLLTAGGGLLLFGRRKQRKATAAN